MASISTRYSGLANEETTRRVLTGGGVGKNSCRTSATETTVFETGQVQRGPGHVGHASTGGFDHLLQVDEDLTGLGGCITFPDQGSVLVEGHLTGDEENSTRRDDPVGVVAGRRRMPRHLDQRSFEVFSHLVEPISRS